jgi:hypothetical protein
LRFCEVMSSAQVTLPAIAGGRIDPKMVTSIDRRSARSWLKHFSLLRQAPHGLFDDVVSPSKKPEAWTFLLRIAQSGVLSNVRAGRALNFWLSTE